jgi:hypothetical protein
MPTTAQISNTHVRPVTVHLPISAAGRSTTAFDASTDEDSAGAGA